MYEFFTNTQTKALDFMAKTLRKTAEVRPGQYIGQTLNQVRHGHGKYLYDNTFFTYEGDWLEGNALLVDKKTKSRISQIRLLCSNALSS